MTSLTNYRDHCRQMATAEHRPECRVWVEGRWHGSWEYPDPGCPGCVTDADRALFAQLADECDSYLASQPSVDLFGEVAEGPPDQPVTEEV